LKTSRKHLFSDISAVILRRNRRLAPYIVAEPVRFSPQVGNEFSTPCGILCGKPRRNAGFSTAGAEELYLPVDTACGAPDVAEQQSRPDSLWHTVRMLTGIRRRHDALNAGSDFKLLLADYPMIYTRSSENEKLLIVIQPARRAWQTEIVLPEGVTKLIPVISTDISAEVAGNKLKLSGTAGTQSGIWQMI